MKVVLFSVFLCLNAAAAEPSRISGRVTDSEGAAIGSAHVFIRPDIPGQNYLYVNTDSSGKFNAQVAPGFYDICIMANAFAPKCRKVLVKTGATGNINAHLKASDIVMKSLGDVF